MELVVDGEVFPATLLEEAAPETAAFVRTLLPLHTELMHVRWSGHATWINIDEVDLPEIPRENHTVYPSRGDLLFYPGYKNEQEILVSCGPTCFKSPAGELAGNHFATLAASPESLDAIERRTLREGVLRTTLRLTE
jgi:hypothetical protein